MKTEQIEDLKKAIGLVEQAAEILKKSQMGLFSGTSPHHPNHNRGKEAKYASDAASQATDEANKGGNPDLHAQAAELHTVASKAATAAGQPTTALHHANMAAHHVAYTRTNASGTTSSIQAKGSPTHGLDKAIKLTQSAGELLKKSHIKEHTRVSASGAVSQVKAYDDKRQAAEHATGAAEKSQSEVNWDKAKSAREAGEAHIKAGHAHVEALKHAQNNEDINHHLHAASRHFQAGDSMHSFANSTNKENTGKNHTKHADTAEKHAWELGKHARDTDVDEDSAEGLNKKVSLHMLAMEQHNRAEGHHKEAANKNFDDKEVSGYHMHHAQDNRDAAHEHGKEVQRLSGKSVDATNHAYDASDKADRSGKPEDHKAAADAHRHAATLNYDSEGKTDHEAKAAEHDKKATGSK